MDKYIVALFFLVSSFISHAETGPLYTLTLNGIILTVTPTANHYYPAAGILIGSGQSVSGCTPQGNGYCLFDMGPSNPKTLIISGGTASLSGIICLNGKGPYSCQQFTIGDSGDDNGGGNGASCSGAKPVCRVFVSSTTTNGNIGGLAGGNAFCQNLANTAGLSGTWAAWLSDLTTDATTNISYNANIFYVRATETSTIIANQNQLISGNLNTSILRTEMGSAITADVWTGTNADGTGAGNSCGSWTIGTNATTAVYGVSNATNATWTADALIFCNTLKALYCFEVPT